MCYQRSKIDSQSELVSFCIAHPQHNLSARNLEHAYLRTCSGEIRLADSVAESVKIGSAFITEAFPVPLPVLETLVILPEFIRSDLILRGTLGGCFAIDKPFITDSSYKDNCIEIKQR